MSTEQQNINWDKLLRDFRENRCILLLGPRINLQEIGGKQLPLQEKLASHIADLLLKEQIPFDEKEHFKLPYVAQQYLKSKENRPVDLCDMVVDFYENHTQQIPPIFQKLAELPVSLIVSTTPDDVMLRALRDKEKEPYFQHYNFLRNIPFKLDSDIFSPQKPLIYNLLGSIKDIESLVLTESDHLKFVRKVLEKNPPVPDELISKFRPHCTYLFLGFNMENWYLRLLIDGLNLCNNTSISPQTDNYPISSATKAFYEERFKFHFIDNGIEEFTGKILEGLATQGETQHQEIVILSAPEDKEYLIGIEKAMKLMEKKEEISLFHRGRITAGEVSDEVMQKKIASADAVILLASSDFFANDDLLDKDLEWAKEKHTNGKGTLIPVITRHCDWRLDRDLRKVTPLPEDGLPISTSPDKDEAYQRIVHQLKRRLA